MAYWLKKTTIFEISVLNDFFAINSGADFIKTFRAIKMDQIKYQSLSRMKIKHLKNTLQINVEWRVNEDWDLSHTDFDFDPLWLDWEKLTSQPIWFNLYLYLPSAEIFFLII